MNRSLSRSGRGTRIVIGLALLWALTGCGGGGGGDGDDPRQATAIDPNASVNGTLTSNDYKAPDGSFFDLYEVTLAQAGTFTVRLESADFDSYVLLFEGAALAEGDLNQWDPYLLAEDDDSGGGFDAELTLDLAAGTYLVAANSLEVGGVGNYTLHTAFTPAAPLQLGNVYLQYRAYEGGTGDRYQGWFQLNRAGAPVEETDVTEIRVFDPSGAPLQPTSSGFQPGEYFFLDCRVAPCTSSGPTPDNGFWAIFPPLAAGSYDLEVDTRAGQTLVAQIDYPGQLVLPFVQAASLQAQWVGNDLTLSWENPAAAANWSEVDRVQVTLFDGGGKEVLYVALPSTDNNVTVRGALLDQAAALGDGTLAQWQVQTRAYDANNMNFARGYSARTVLPSRDNPFWALGPSRYLQYRTYEDNTLNRYQVWLPMTKDGVPIAETDVLDARLFDPQNILVEPLGGTFYTTEYWSLNCSVTPCTTSGPLRESALRITPSTLVQGTYELEVDMTDGQTLLASIPYPGRLTVPVVTAASMQAQWLGEELHLSWVNPTGDPLWGDISRIYVVFYDGSNRDVLYVRLPPTATDVTVPGTLLSQAAASGDGTLAHWAVQTRVYDNNGMNYARGYSGSVPLP